MYLERSIFIHTFNLFIFFFKFFVCVVFEFIWLPYWFTWKFICNSYSWILCSSRKRLWASFEFSIGAFNTRSMSGTGPLDRVFLSLLRLNWTLCLSILFCGALCLSFRGSALGSPANGGRTWFSLIWSLPRSLGRGRSGAVSALSS